jgi:hypothetical protein
MMEGQEIVDSFDTTFEQDYLLRMRFLSRLRTICEQDASGSRCVAALASRIERDFDLLPARKKPRADWILAQLAGLLPTKDRAIALAKLVMHHRLSRRQSGYKIMRQIGDACCKDALVESFRMYGDEDALITLLRLGGDVRDVGDHPKKIIQKLTEDYHQSVAIERILLRDEQLAISLSHEFPRGFIWAAGRQKYYGARQFIMEHFAEAVAYTRACTNVQTLVRSSRDLWLFVWALGRLNAIEELNDLAREYEIAVPWVSSTLPA